MAKNWLMDTFITIPNYGIKLYEIDKLQLPIYLYLSLNDMIELYILLHACIKFEI